MKAKGFTLLEVLIAITIITLAFVSLFVTLTEVIGNHDHLRDKTYATWVADNIMHQATSEVWVEPGQNPDQGKSTMGQKIFHWEVFKQKTPDQEIDKVFVRVYRDEQLLIETIGYTASREAS